MRSARTQGLQRDLRIPHTDSAIMLHGGVEIVIDRPEYAGEFIRLNELWIQEYFALEEADRDLARDPWQVVRGGRRILFGCEKVRVVGVCALIRESTEKCLLARMAVEPSKRRKGHGEALLREALCLARGKGARSVGLFSNTRLESAIALYRKHGFRAVSQGECARYARCNVVMELELRHL